MNTVPSGNRSDDKSLNLGKLQNGRVRLSLDSGKIKGLLGRFWSGVLLFLACWLAVVGLIILLGWRHPSQEAAANLAITFALFASIASVIWKDPVKGLLGFLLFWAAMTALLSLLVIMGVSMRVTMPATFGVEGSVQVDHCESSADKYSCKVRITVEGQPPVTTTMLFDKQPVPGEVISGAVAEVDAEGHAKFYPGEHTQPRPPLVRSTLLALIVLYASWRIRGALWRAFRAKDWGVLQALIKRGRNEMLLRRGAVAAAITAACVCFYLLVQQIGVEQEGVVVKFLGLSAGDWMTIDSLSIALVAWGYRHSKSPLAKPVVSTSARASLFMVAVCAVVFLFKQISALVPKFMPLSLVKPWYETFDKWRDLNRAFDYSTMLATVALLVTAYFLTLQFHETGESAADSSGSWFAPEALDMIRYVASGEHWARSVAEVEERFPDQAEMLRFLVRLKVLEKANRRIRLTKLGKTYAP